MEQSLSQQPAQAGRKINYFPVKETYDLWAPIYDNDGNILQSLDSHGLSQTLLPRLFSLLANKPNPSSCLQITDLGTGTGRATLALLSALQTPSNSTTLAHLFPTNLNEQSLPLKNEIHITGLDASGNMLSIARSRIPATSSIPLPSTIEIHTSFHTHDILSPTQNPAIPYPPADAIICALVLEHIPSPSILFRQITTTKLLKHGGFLLLTNMHPDMARGVASAAASGSDGVGKTKTARLVTQAGFKDPETGEKVRPEEDWAHTIEDVMDAAGREGYKLASGEDGGAGMEELRVERWMLETGVVDKQRGEKWARGGGKCWFGGCGDIQRPSKLIVTSSDHMGPMMCTNSNVPISTSSYLPFLAH
ncbi:uncharacterized protein KY384_006550 [Bacidia gigantensis]|uniref:uncharacterized protein n=1 Tax=Bacidia gigantensis TaxID=2732470 RepID=UPI001D0513FC|nr:uncharacterized protein KY384_006550 [Bacidia gigantensis]KAG8528861.1 hypothetical protein KY384_006550 [Bacidia gigantensis]